MTATLRNEIQIERLELPILCPSSVEQIFHVGKGLEILCRFTVEGNAMQYRFFYPEAYLEQWHTPAERPFGMAGSMQHHFGEESTVCCALREVFLQLATNKSEGIFRKLFLESQALLVLMHTHEQKESIGPCFACKFLNIPSEKQKIMQARVILTINLAEPPTIPQLARSVHINECYLKKGFREMYGCSVFDYVQQQRVQKARQLLLDGRHAIQDIALELGYSNTSNFTNAFRKLNGCSPSDWVKRQISVSSSAG